MKTNSSLCICLLCVIFSCKKEKKEPPPEVRTGDLEIYFGHESPSGFNFKMFGIQDSIPNDSIAAHQYFGVSISERYLPFIPKPDTIVFQFEARTKNDLEHLDSRTFIGKKQTYWFNFDGALWGLGMLSTDIHGIFLIPYKFSTFAKHNNDTLEFTHSSDIIFINYQSLYSIIKGTDSLTITP